MLYKTLKLLQLSKEKEKRKRKEMNRKEKEKEREKRKKRNGVFMSSSHSPTLGNIQREAR